MLSLLLSSVLTLTATLPSSVPASAPPPRAQDEGEELPDKREEIKELLGQLKDHIGERGDQDTEAIGVIDKLVQEFPKSGPKDRDSIVGGIAKCLEERRKDLEDGVPDNRLYLASAVALGEMGPESVKPLSKYIGHKKLEDDLVVQRQLILSLGKTKHVDGLKALMRCLDNHQAAIVAAGAEALGQYSETEQKVRKEVFEELLKVLMSAKGQMDTDVNDLIARERYEVIAAPIITSLGRISGQDIRDPNEWRNWWNKNKKDDWDDPDR